MLFFRRLFQVDKIDAVYFFKKELLFKSLLIFTESNKTEAGSAGEQPVRDSLMADKKVMSKGYQGIIF